MILERTTDSGSVVKFDTEIAYRHAYKLIRHEQDAEDIAQSAIEIFLRRESVPSPSRCVKRAFYLLVRETLRFRNPPKNLAIDAAQYRDRSELGYHPADRLMILRERMVESGNWVDVCLIDGIIDAGSIKAYAERNNMARMTIYRRLYTLIQYA